ncbi:MAG TPA: HAD family phosphatase [Streptosporangiaceae bacterium]|nr:HAD family phosphatase [Streptosporangiaceae bacterium]
MFDMDGLLVDTEPLWFEVESEVMARLGGTWSHADQAELVGGALAASVSYLLAKAAPAPRRGSARPGQWPPSAATVAGWLVGAMTDRIATRGGPLMPGAAELLAGLAAAGLPRALVTSSERSVMDAVLTHLTKAHGQDASCQGGPGAPPSRLFDVTVCAADVAHAKPHPEPYQHAARLLGADPARCVVLEDAPNGVAAAEAAGCVVVVVPGVAAPAPREGRIMVSSLREVSAGWLRELVASRHTSAR